MVTAREIDGANMGNHSAGCTVELYYNTLSLIISGKVKGWDKIMANILDQRNVSQEETRVNVYI